MAMKQIPLFTYTIAVINCCSLIKNSKNGAEKHEYTVLYPEDFPMSETFQLYLFWLLESTDTGLLPQMLSKPLLTENLTKFYFKSGACTRETITSVNIKLWFAF